MKTLIIMAALILMGCCTTCPKETCYIPLIVDDGIYIYEIKKGYFDNPDNYLNKKEKDEFDEKYQELIEKLSKGGVL